MNVKLVLFLINSNFIIYMNINTSTSKFKRMNYWLHTFVVFLVYITANDTDTRLCVNIFIYHKNRKLCIVVAKFVFNIPNLSRDA